MENQHYYKCNYCYKEYEPQRRGAQKYCSNSCRSKAYHSRQKQNSISASENETSMMISKELNSEKMSIAGVGNAVAGTVAADLLKTMLTKETNKPATKGDIKSIIEQLQGRYHLVKNMPVDGYGRYPYYDMLNNIVIYLQ